MSSIIFHIKIIFKVRLTENLFNIFSLEKVYDLMDLLVKKTLKSSVNWANKVDNFPVVKLWQFSSCKTFFNFFSDFGLLNI